MINLSMGPLDPPIRRFDSARKMPRKMRRNLKIESYCGGNFLETGADKSAGRSVARKAALRALPDLFLLCLFVAN